MFVFIFTLKRSSRFKIYDWNLLKFIEQNLFSLLHFCAHIDFKLRIESTVNVRFKLKVLACTLSSLLSTKDWKVLRSFPDKVII